LFSQRRIRREVALRLRAHQRVVEKVVETLATLKWKPGFKRCFHIFNLCRYIAAVRVGLKFHYPPVPFNKLMVQPPADVRLGRGCLLHYTWWGCTS
jgi:hypothetical protein